MMAVSGLRIGSSRFRPLQERRAILYAAQGEIDALKELIEILEKM
jgi:hypothetical protein